MSIKEKNYMKKISIFSFVILSLLSCKKDVDCTSTKGKILIVEPTCRFTFKKELFIAEGKTDTLIVDSLPPQYKVNNLLICADTEQFLDLALCACCGNQWVKLKKIKER
jgi:hypothetical protein